MQPGEEVVVATGGRGGLGNATLASRLKVPLRRRRVARTARKQVRVKDAAAEAMQGGPGQQRHIRLELKLIADVGIVGFPNAGKSSLLARISTARPKIGAYPFTTRYPVLGVVSVNRHGSFVACDIPGLIEGAHEGRGLGIQFLRHIERTRLLVHVIDMAAMDGRDPVASFHQLNHELAAYSPALPRRPQVIAANKMDLPPAREHLAAFERAIGRPVWPISCATGMGMSELIQAVWKELQAVVPVDPVER